MVSHQWWGSLDNGALLYVILHEAKNVNQVGIECEVLESCTLRRHGGTSSDGGQRSLARNDCDLFWSQNYHRHLACCGHGFVNLLAQVQVMKSDSCSQAYGTKANSRTGVGHDLSPAIFFQSEVESRVDI